MRRKIVINGCFLLLLLTFFMPILTINVSSASTIYVDNSNTSGPWDGSQNNPYITIQDAINQSSDGDTIYVNSGTYYQNIVINKSINLFGENKDTTIIHSSSIGPQGQVISIPDGYNGVSIQGFTIKSNLGGWKPVIHVWSSNNKIQDNIIDEGSIGISISNSDNNQIYDNDLQELGTSGLFFEGSSNNIIYGNNFKDITTGSPFASVVIANNCNDNEIYNNDFTGTSGGYSVKIQSTTSNNIFYHNNIEGSGDGAYCCDDSGDNYWYNSTLSEGNYWAAYSGSDNNSDGIGETPFDINCLGSTQDLYPYISENGWDNQAPSADGGGPYSAEENTSIIFDASSSYDNDGSIVSYNWDFGNGETFNTEEQTTSYTYTSSGTYTVTLIVTDNYGLNDSDTTQVTISEISIADSDSDGISDESDNCPNTYNPLQEDTDFDGIGDVCDNEIEDTDNDGIINENDNCPNTYNPNQIDSDGDGIGDSCDTISISKLIINSQYEIYEEKMFKISISSEGASIENAYVEIKGTTLSGYTSKDGFITFNLPSVDKDTQYTIKTTKTGYESSESTILIKNQVNNIEKNVFITGLVFEKLSNTSLPIKNAKVCIIISNNNNVQTKKCTFTDENGTYNLSIEIGVYNLTASKKGYSKSEKKEIEIKEDKEINFELEKTTSKEKNTIVDYTIENEINSGNIGLRIDISNKKADLNIYQDTISANINSFDDKDSNTLIDFTISAPSNTPGTKIVLYLGQINPDDIKVEYDKKNLEKTNDIKGFFSKENTQINYALFSSNDEWVLIINNPKFSTHSIKIISTEVIEKITENTPLVILIASVILISAAAITFRKSRV